MLPKLLKLHLFLFLLQQPITIILTSVTFTHIRITLFPFPITPTIQFQTLNILAQTSIEHQWLLNLMLLGQKLILGLDTMSTAQSNETQLVGVQEAAAMLLVTFVYRTIAFMYVFVSGLAWVAILLFCHLVLVGLSWQAREWVTTGHCWLSSVLVCGWSAMIAQDVLVEVGFAVGELQVHSA